MRDMRGDQAQHVPGSRSRRRSREDARRPRTVRFAPHRGGVRGTVGAAARARAGARSLRRGAALSAARGT